MRLHISIFVDQIDFPIFCGPLAAHADQFILSENVMINALFEWDNTKNAVTLRTKQKTHFFFFTTSILIRNNN